MILLNFNCNYGLHLLLVTFRNIECISISPLPGLQKVWIVVFVELLKALPDGGQLLTI
jgi:hypothetical protein